MRWVEPERQVRLELAPRLSQHLRLARLTHRFIEAAIGTAMPGRETPPSHAAEVQARLLVKSSHELRVIEWAAKHSYVLQALGLAATVYELTSAIAFISNNDERARKWENHKDSRRSYPSPAQRKKGVRALIRTFVPNAPDLKARVAYHEQLHEVFCMAKHGNPKALRRFGVAVQGDRVQLYHGPFVTKYVVRQARFALFNASWLTVSATAVFAKPLLEEAPAEKRRRYNRLDATVADLIIRLWERDRSETDTD
jgi:hypothetical protein